MEQQDQTGLAAVETHLIHLLESSTPPRAAHAFDVTGAAQEFHAQHGTWDVAGVDPEVFEQVLARHGR